MPAKKDAYYFELLQQCAACTTGAAGALIQLADRAFAGDVYPYIQKTGAFLQKSRTLRADLAAQLARAFVTPLDRGDLLRLQAALQSVTAGVADLPVQMYFLGLQRPPAGVKPLLLWPADYARAQESLFTDFQNCKKYAIIQKSLARLRLSITAGTRLCLQAARTCPGDSRSLCTGFWTLAARCHRLADTAEEVILTNL